MSFSGNHIPKKRKSSISQIDLHQMDGEMNDLSPLSEYSIESFGSNSTRKRKRPQVKNDNIIMNLFNRGSDSFNEITDLNDFIIGRNYLIRVRRAGEKRQDFIGKLRISLGNLLYFRILYKRFARINNDDPYNQWTLFDIEFDFPVIEFDFPNADVIVFDLGDHSHLITSMSPDDVNTYLNTSLLALDSTPVHTQKRHILSYLGGKKQKTKNKKQKTKNKKQKSKNNKQKNKKTKNKKQNILKIFPTYFAHNF